MYMYVYYIIYIYIYYVTEAMIEKEIEKERNGSIRAMLYVHIKTTNKLNKES